MTTDTSLPCSDDSLAEVVNELRNDDIRGLEALNELISHHPRDARLHFLRWSILAGLQRYPEGRSAMLEAVTIAPEFALARFQLGFLELTSGLADDAARTWLPFALLDDDAPFRLLSDGLNALAHNDFSSAKHLITRGVNCNNEHPLINADMQLILDEIADKPAQEVGDLASEPASAADLLLRQFALRDGNRATRH